MADEARVKKRISLKETFKNLVPELNEENVMYMQVATAVLVGLVTLSKKLFWTISSYTQTTIF